MPLLPAVPPPLGALPDGGLPLWPSLPLEQKLPLVPMPRGFYVFSRGKLGENLQATCRLPSLDTSPAPLPPYSALHDPHLRAHVRRAARTPGHPLRAQLHAGRPTCSLSEYNQHRRQLARRQARVLAEEIAKKDLLERDTLAMRRADEETAKRQELLRQRTRRAEACREAIARCREERRHKEMEILERQQKLQRKAERMEQLRLRRRQELEEKAQQRRQLQQARLEASRERGTLRRISCIRDIQTKERRHSRMTREGRERRHSSWQERERQKWARIYNSQIEKLNNASEAQTGYSSAPESEGNRSQGRIASYKKTGVNRSKTLEKKNKQLQEAIVKMWKNKFGQESAPPGRMLEELYRSALMQRRDQLAVMMEVQRRMEGLNNVPLVVWEVTEELLTRTVLESTKRDVFHILESVFNEQVWKIRNSCLDDDTAALNNHNKGNLHKKGKGVFVSLRRSQRISFGAVNHVYPERDSALGELRSCKTRPPTPTVSAACLVDAALSPSMLTLELEEQPARKPRGVLEENLRRLNELISKETEVLVRRGLVERSYKVEEVKAKMSMPELLRRLSRLACMSARPGDVTACGSVRGAAARVAYEVLYAVRMLGCTNKALARSLMK